VTPGARRADGVFDDWPELLTLRGKVPDEVIAREVAEKEREFVHWRTQATALIPAVRLRDVLPERVESGRITLHHFLGQWGNVSVEEIAKMALIAKWLRPRAILEFGTYNGMTTLQLAINSPANCTVHTVDLPPDAAEVGDLAIGEIDQFLAAKLGAFSFEVGHYFHGAPQESRIHQIWGDSTRLDYSAYAGAVDMVFVDAGHTYEYVKSDTNNALQMVRPGGVVLWHDYLQVLHPGVTRVLAELCADGYVLSHLRGTHLAVYRDPFSRRSQP
jgi:predicted O-methyltransferase YrrM